MIATPSVAISCAATLWVIFEVSLVAKSGEVRFRAFMASAGPLGVFPVRWRAQAAGAVVMVELTVTTALAVWAVAALFGYRLAWLRLVGFGGASCLLVGFTVGIGVALRRGDRPPCRCFGASSTLLRFAHIIRNLVLIAVAVGCLAGVSATTPELIGLFLGLVAGVAVGSVIANLDHVPVAGNAS